ncbi:hypothetical protein CSUB01_08556 [Colletotrichum sublineola]|uniref:Ubiquitin-like protease family profile domain-containing protein n=1 Tax=Colletotrichum sublineola TaxID=1173701 RepID=A0A066X721_COLSU|nr:hypothetical protein CSUB01_08556 [Colletotrichum sublineola]
MSGGRYNLRRSARLKNEDAPSLPPAKRLKAEAKSAVIVGVSKPAAKAEMLPILSTEFLLWSLRENPDISFGPSRPPSPVTTSSPFPDDAVHDKPKVIADAPVTPKTQKQKDKEEDEDEEGSRGATKSPKVIRSFDDELVLHATPGPAGYRHALASLNPQSWLNDDVVFRTLEFLATRDDNFGVVNPINFQAASMWDTAPAYFRPHHEARLGNKKTLLIPVCHASHWTLFVWSSDGSVIFYDSLFSQSHLVDSTDRLRRFWSAAFGSGKPIRDPVRADCAQQSNGYDCGLHVIRNGDMAIGRQDPDRPEPRSAPSRCGTTTAAFSRTALPE